MTYAFNDKTERFHELRTKLENLIAVAEEEQRTLEEEIKVIRHKVAIQELLKSVRKRRDEFAGLPIQRAKREDQ